MAHGIGAPLTCHQHDTIRPNPLQKQHIQAVAEEPHRFHFCLVHRRTGEVANLVDVPASTGHPTINRAGSLLVTDATSDKGLRRRVGVRLVDIPGGTWRDIAEIESPSAVGEMAPTRRDAHMTWDRPGKRMLLVGAPRGKRQLFIADPALPPATDFDPAR